MLWFNILVILIGLEYIKSNMNVVNYKFILYDKGKTSSVLECFSTGSQYKQKFKITNHTFAQKPQNRDNLF